MFRSHVFLAAGLLAATAATAAPQVVVPERPTAEQRADIERRLNDWPDLARYAKDNAALGTPKSGQPRVVFMGDSITDAWGREIGSFFPGHDYVNRGISGQTTPQMLLRFRPDVVALKPAAVVILAGTNDIAGNTGPETLETIEGNLASMAELAKANGIRVVLASVMPVSDYVGNGQTKQRPPQKILALNAWIKAYAARVHHCRVVVEVDEVLARGQLTKELSYDGLHPNAAGYDVMAPLAEKAIAEALRGEH